MAEPTRCEAVLAHRGISAVRLAFRGVAGHASGPGALDASALHAIATRAGMHSLYEDGLRKVAAGVTSLDEVLRVTQDQGET